ncbi:MAG: RHS repeat-associated core domain-containing protein [Anaerolineae bacterium]|nr:RHS repeat-associated core domain-containing protein [Anaerolineae bacterium]
MYNYGARWYDPSLGRFLQPDPLVPEPGNPQALNRYSYVLNNPIKYTDPSGHWVETAWDLFSIGLTLNDIRREGLTWQNGLALTVDVGAALLPGVPAFAGVAMKAGKAAVEVAGHADEAGEAVRLAGHMGDGTHAVLTASMLLRAGENTVEASALVKALAKQGTKGELKQGTIVSLGHFREVLGRPGYIDWAKSTRATYLDLDPAVYEMLHSAGKWWEINRQFLDDAIAVGAEFHLQLPKAMRVDSYFQREIDYLLQKGYRLVEENGEFWLRRP